MFKIFSFFSPILLIADPGILWFEEYSGSGEESIGHFILSCEDGGYLQVGETYDYATPSSKVLIVKTNSAGQILWHREIFDGNHNLGNSAIEMDDGYLISGSLGYNSALMKFNKEDGSTIFIKTFDNGGTDAFENAVITPNGIIAVGYNYAEDPENTFFTEGKGFMMLLDLNGNELSSRSLSDYIDQAYRVQYFNDELIISGLAEDASDYKLIKMSLEGDVIWHYTYGGNEEDHCFGMDINNFGDIFLTGHTQSGTVNWDTYTLKINNDGTLLWENKIGNPRGFDPQYIHDEAWDIKATNDGGCVVIAGTGDEYINYSECLSDDCSDVWNAYIIKFDNHGEIMWEKTFASHDINDEIYDWAGEAIDLTGDGGAIIAIDNGQFGFLRVSNVQNSELINYSEIKNAQTFALSANYPNPFNPSTEIPYFIAKRSLININIIDVRGNHIISLVNKYQPAGNYSTFWKGTNENNELVSAGIYFYRLAAGDYSEVRKMVLLK